MGTRITICTLALTRFSCPLSLSVPPHRIFKLTDPDVQVSEQLLHASVISMIEFNEDIFAAGNCFDWDRHPVQKGLFCPFAHRLSPPSPGMALVKNLADEYHYLDNGSEWFYIARKNAERIIEKNEQHVKSECRSIVGTDEG